MTKTKLDILEFSNNSTIFFKSRSATIKLSLSRLKLGTSVYVIIITIKKQPKILRSHSLGHIQFALD